MRTFGMAFIAIAAAASTPAVAQIETIDPNTAANRASTSRQVSPVAERADPVTEDGPSAPPTSGAEPAVPVQDAKVQAHEATVGGTYQEDDVLAAAEGVFGRGAEGLAKLIEDVFRKQGRPNAYIVGREVGGAIIAGVRYGSGTLYHKVEGQRPVFWQGPSVGFDLGANGSKTFVLVYNLYDSQDLFKRFPAGEGNVYVVGGFTASYLRWGHVVLVPIRLGVGWRLGVNAGYMNFTEKRRWSPF